MNPNDKVLFEQAFGQRKDALRPTASDSNFFEFFSAEQLLRDYPLSPDDIDSGIVGHDANKPKRSGSDGGIDSMYVMVNGKLVRDLDQALHLQHLNGSIIFDVIIIQSKLGDGFKLTPIDRLSATLETIFDLAIQPQNFPEKFNSPLTDIIQCFRASHLAIGSKATEFNVRILYAAKADRTKVHGPIEGKARALETKLKKHLSTITSCEFEFVGAKELYKLAKRLPSFDFELDCFDAISDEDSGFIALVKLSDYFKMISDGPSMREGLFDSNVRDYQGDVTVNEDIRLTLENADEKPRFWWLNNGITILADKVTGGHRKLHIFEPRIVNGLQTSQVIFNYFKNKGPNPQDSRLAVVKVIQSPDVKNQDRVVKATNSQTQIPIQYLRASEDIQREIEAAFKMDGLHYDRRKNSWRKAGVPLEKVVGMTELVQSIAAVFLEEPDHARARPSRYFRDNQQYLRAFPRSRLLKSYVVCARLKKRVEAFLKVEEKEVKDRNNLIFYVLFALKYIVGAQHIEDADLDLSTVTDKMLHEALGIVRPVYIQEGDKIDDADKAAKGTAMLIALKKTFQKKSASVRKRTRQKQ